MALLCRAYPETGIAVSVRFHGYEPLDEIEVNVGSAIRPYRTGSAKTEWLAAKPERARAIYELARHVRTRLGSAVKARRLKARGRPDSP